MKMELTAPSEEPLRLLDIQAVPYDGGILLKRGLTRMHLTGDDLMPALSAIIDHARSDAGATRSQLVEAVDPEHEETVAALIEALQARRLLVSAAAAEGIAADDVHEAVFYWNYGSTAKEVRGRLAEKRLAVVGVNHVGVALTNALSGLGFGEVTLIDHPMMRNASIGRGPEINPVAFGDWQEAEDLPDCIVLTSDFGGPDLASDWNRFCVEQNIHFYAVFIQDQTGLIGPMVVPGETACYECFARREAASSRQSASSRATDEAAYFSQYSYGFLKPITDSAASIAATELLKFYSHAVPGNRIGQLVEVDLIEPALTVRRVLKAPRCPVCSTVRAEPTQTPEIGMFMPGNE